MQLVESSAMVAEVLPDTMYKLSLKLSSIRASEEFTTSRGSPKLSSWMPATDEILTI